MKNTLWKLRLNSDNSIVISSGILQALGIRNSKDIDVVVSQEMFNYLKKSGNFKVIKSQGRETLANNMFEIGTNWPVLGKSYKLEDLIKQSLIIEGVRYITIDFLYEVKKSQASKKNVSKKNIEDIKLIEKYIGKY
jgi:hypothetical protein